MSLFLILGRFLGEAVASEGPKRKVLCCRSAPGVRTVRKLSRDQWRSALSEVSDMPDMSDMSLEHGLIRTPMWSATTAGSIPERSARTVSAAAKCASDQRGTGPT